MGATPFIGGILSGVTGQANKNKEKGKSKLADLLKRSKKIMKVGDPGGKFTSEDEGDEGSRKRGGPIRKTARYRLHRGEQVLTAKQAKQYRSKKR